MFIVIYFVFSVMCYVLAMENFKRSVYEYGYLDILGLLTIVVLAGTGLLLSSIYVGFLKLSVAV
jgi:hypothetical protein